jgi:adenylate cyclase
VRRDRLRTALFLIVAAGSIVLTVALYFAPTWKPVRSAFASTADLERKSIDSRFQIRGTKRPPANLAVVGIDDITFGDVQQRWPFRRQYHANVINRLAHDGAKLIVYDVQFTEPSDRPDDDNNLILACRAARNCVLSTTELDKKGRSRVFGGEEGLAFARAKAGDGRIPQDPDGVLRKVALNLQGLKSLAVVAAEQVSGRKITQQDLGGRRAYLDYYGKPGTIPEIPFSHLCGDPDPKLSCGHTAHGKPIKIEQTPPGFFKDKIVVVGPVAPTLQDVHATSAGGGEMPGAEIQATAIGAALAGFPLQDSPPWLDVLMIILLGLVAPLASLRLRLWGIALAGVAALVYAAVVQIAFDNGLILSFTYPLGALILSSVGALAVHYVTEAFERARVRENFARFVPESVVGDVLDQADGARLGGVGRYATVMFSDLRGFTSFAEQLEPDQVIHILNRYLTAMVDDAIIPNGGTLVDYMGDGIMAVFGAPIEMTDHADRALAAARAKLRQLELFNEWMHDEYGFDKSFRMGVGLNSGQVMSGNVGSERRLAYTAIGDTTNTAARLEGMTKGTDFMLFMSESTKNALSNEPEDVAFVGQYEIRGRIEKLTIWSVEESRKTKDEGGSFASVAQTETLADK